MGGREGRTEGVENSPVIDASTFSRAHHAFWNSNTPTCEHFVRKLNMGGLRRFAPMMAPHENTKRYAVVAEFAFSLFVARREAGPNAEASQIELEAWRATEMRLAPLIQQGIDLQRALNVEEIVEVNSIAARLTDFFADATPPLILRPVFAGCGYIDASEGDVISGDIIYEIKTVDRLVRSADMRQVVTYAALDSESGQFQINKMGIFNPRGGYCFHLDAEFICAEIAGMSARELFRCIVDAISSGEISR